MIVAFVDEGLGNSSYLVDLQDGRALVVDPFRDPTAYVQEARRRGLRIAFALETHLHADFVSGGRELAAAGAELLAPGGAALRFPFRGLNDGEEVDLGGLVLRAISTPGHTPEHMTYLLLDGAEPLAAFTGGALIVGSVARTDLISAQQTEQLTRAAYRSAHRRLASLPDNLGVYPTHGAGSFCSAPGGDERVSTIGRERSTNLVLRTLEENEFAMRFMAQLGSYPPYFLRLREVNRAGAPLYGTRMPELAVLDEVPADALVVDVRPFKRYAAGHLPGSVSIEFRPAFATWLGWVAEPEQRLVLVADPSQDRASLVRECLKIGYENLGGEIALERAGRELFATRLIRPAEAQGTIVDVRQRSEAAAGRIPDAVNVELGQIAQEPGSVREGPLVVHCEHGQRAATAASLLERAGRCDVAIMLGGAEDWSRAHGVPTVRRT